MKKSNDEADTSIKVSSEAMNDLAKKSKAIRVKEGLS